LEKLIQKLERRFGRYAIPNIAAWIVMPKAALFLMGFVYPERFQPMLQQLALVPSKVLEGEVWRLFTFVATPPTSSIIFFFFYVMLVFLFCNGLQSQWGAFRLNLYVLLGWFTSAVASFIANAIAPGYELFGGFLEFETTLMLGFATLYPNFTLNLFLILPVKVKWFGWLIVGGALYRFVQVGPWDSVEAWAARLMIVAVFANYLLFFGPSLIRSTHQKHVSSSRRRDFEEAMRRGHEERDRLLAEDREQKSITDRTREHEESEH